MKRLTCLILACVLLGGCTLRQTKAEETVFCMDTVMSLEIWGADSELALEQVKSLLTELENTWSATKATSQTAALNRGDAELSQEQQAFVDQVEALSARTGGAFDPRLYSLTELWGFPSKEYHVPTQPEIDAALADPRWDLGAAVKGYAGQRAVELLETLDIDRAILNLGGNVQTYGEKADGSAWQIGIQNPDGGDYVGLLSVTGTASIVTSGDYQRYFEENGTRYHHIMDPQTGRPSDSGLASVTVICRDGTTADALSTALFVMGLEQGAAFWRESDDFEAVFILSSGEIFATAGANLSGCAFEVIDREN